MPSVIKKKTNNIKRNPGHLMMTNLAQLLPDYCFTEFCGQINSFLLVFSPLLSTTKLKWSINFVVVKKFEENFIMIRIVTPRKCGIPPKYYTLNANIENLNEIMT
jgi:hypothetical protein